MTYYVKKPIAIEAIQLTKNNFEDVEKFIGVKPDTYRDYQNEVDFLKHINPVGLFINTLEGTMCAKIGDYIIKGVKGEFYPCKPDIFEQSYDIAGNDQ